MNIWDKITQEVNQHGYMSGVDRQSDRVKATGEIFTPTNLVIEILQKMLDHDDTSLASGKTVLDPACGDGQFLVSVKLVKMYLYNMSEKDALADIYGVDIMRDNVDLCKRRLGGGTIIMGNALKPEMRLQDQTEYEYQKMKELFLENVNTLPF